MKVNKSLIGIVAGLGIYASAYAQEIKQFQYPPQGIGSPFKTNWVDPDYRNFGVLEYWDRNNDGIYDLTGAFRSCETSTGIKTDDNPFGIFDEVTGELYLDHNLDGVTDEYIQYIPDESNRAIGEDAPACADNKEDRKEDTA